MPGIYTLLILPEETNTDIRMIKTLAGLVQGVLNNMNKFLFK